MLALTPGLGFMGSLGSEPASPNRFWLASLGVTSGLAFLPLPVEAMETELARGAEFAAPPAAGLPNPDREAERKLLHGQRLIPLYSARDASLLSPA